MAINLKCENNKCKNYFELHCIKNLNEEKLEIDENGKCMTFEEGLSDCYLDISDKLPTKWTEEQDRQTKKKYECNFKVKCYKCNQFFDCLGIHWYE